MEREELELEEILRSVQLLVDTEEQSQAHVTAMQDEAMYARDNLERMGFCEPQMDEIAIGLRQQLPVWQYAKVCYNWKQMRQIRLGLLENLDVSQYDNQLFSAEQMQEIRMGLMDHLDVSSYASLLYSTKDMATMRKNLLSDAYQECPAGYARQMLDEESGIRIRLQDDCMQAFITLPEDGTFTAVQLERILSRNGIIHGIVYEQLQRAAEGAARGQEWLAARGTPATTGADGRYDFFFDICLPGEPVQQPDGTVDYTQVIVADRRSKGDLLARYHSAKKGSDGETVTGIPIQGVRGKELAVLSGSGISRDVEKQTYTATRAGYVLLDEKKNTLNVWDVYEIEGDVNRYTGQIHYDGVVHVKGAVRDMAQIEASGNVVVDGYVENAHIYAGENIILRSGMNGCGTGVLQAGGRVAGKFFEGASIYARGKVEGNYFLNCYVETDDSVIARGTKSKIMGGTIRAAYAVEACTITDYGRGLTAIDVGDYAWFGKREKKTLEQLDKVKEELQQLRDGKKKVSGMFGEEAAKQNALFHKICVALHMKHAQQRELEAEREYEARLARRAQNAYVLVRSMVQEGVRIGVHGEVKKIESDITGMVTFK